MSEYVLEVQNLKTHFHTKKGIVKAVDGVDLKVKQGEILAVVGESGCGKSVTSQSIMRLVGQKKSEEVSGQVLYRGEDLLKKTEREMQHVRGKDISMIFQDPMTSLNPAYTVGTQIAEMPMIHENKDKKSAWRRAVEMLKKVGIPSPDKRVHQYPHQFSGGMRQRGVIAMSLSCDPDLIIADEPTTALDVTIQAQVLDLLRRLRDETNAAIVLITHDLGVVAELCDRVAVMYAGKIVEEGSVEDLFDRPKHPYTQGLLKSVPRPGVRERLQPIEGQPPNLHDLPEGCRFAERCPFVMEQCLHKEPALKASESEQHRVACWLEEERNDDDRGTRPRRQPEEVF
ncbi:ABC transporter ATP-binding protein [Halobacillus sp. ACCC02827]|uniref:ABC transporter ATP-binding protein n=1 Tax=unclassified Halobacillus TaxID=2636472 RepID=UPI0002A4FC75|nr:MULTISPECIES: ABC transporter ATP-binding protein [unclassified Halobacillus]ELK47790.1 oligopeptide/dipeptide ABC transporter ATPase [Halobacillus sp. BAB-2008]WJE16270.1 ABC transporter ATP-binding protein [Halobacillus sp. ACCC02827]